MQKVHIGTSGFYYDHWIGRYYPQQTSKRDLLPYYTQHFPTVEINSTFYHFPKQSTIEHWLEVTPEGFLFSLKANRMITHTKRLESVYEEVLTFIRLVKPLKEKLGVILFQFPPSLRLDVGALDAFLSELPKGYRYAVEFRHASWLDDVVFGVLALHNISLCISDFEGVKTPLIATAGHLYIRMHGPLGRYRGKYDAQEINALCETIKGFVKEGKEVFCYFNNDMEGFAWQNAQELIELCRSNR
jgi:uncharacterized protein YecE (DUF72 family)